MPAPDSPGFPLLGEPLALDLVNTRPADGDLLTSPDALRTWLTALGMRLTVPWAAGRIGPAELAAVLDVREHATAAIDAARRGERPPAQALRALNAALAAAPAHHELAWERGHVTTRPHRPGTPAQGLAAELAEAVAELLADPRVTKVRDCEADDCTLLFLPSHPRRRWCAAARCGNRARVARYYERHKADGSREQRA